jgi:hypothetical protein
MKSLFVTLLIFGGAFAAYDYFGAPVGQKILFKNLNKAVPTASPVSAADTAAINPVESPASASAELLAPNLPTLPPVTQMATPPEIPKAPDPTLPRPVRGESNGFVPPTFQPMESLTQNWTKIPPTAFPRPITLLKETLFKMSVGGSTMPAGGRAVALALEGSLLVLAPTEASAARAQAALDDTDFKKQLLDGYETWKSRRTDALRKLHARKLAQNATTEPAESNPAAAVGAGVEPDGKPSRGSDGAYPLLVSHLKSGEVTELKAENIRNWSDVAPTSHEGKPAWTVKVSADVNTVFGLQPVDIMAIVRSGRVVGWYYTGSGEPVP